MKTYCIIYRTGGKDNFKWNRSLAVEKFSEAMEMRDATMREGYNAFIEDYTWSIASGLPEGYTYTFPNA